MKFGATKAASTMGEGLSVAKSCKISLLSNISLLGMMTKPPGLFWTVSYQEPTNFTLKPIDCNGVIEGFLTINIIRK